jgi:hypothetical protein
MAVSALFISLPYEGLNLKSCRKVPLNLQISNYIHNILRFKYGSSMQEAESKRRLTMKRSSKISWSRSTSPSVITSDLKN